MNRIFLLALICLAACGLASAQRLPANRDIFGAPASNSGMSLNASGLLDPSRFSMHQSFSTSFMTSGKHSVFSNLYSNTINYKMADNLELQLDLAYRYTPSQLNKNSGLYSATGSNNQGLFLPSFGMKYQPSNALTIEFQYQKMDPYGYGYYWAR